MASMTQSANTTSSEITGRVLDARSSGKYPSEVKARTGSNVRSNPVCSSRTKTVGCTVDSGALALPKIDFSILNWYGEALEEHKEALRQLQLTQKSKRSPE